MKIDFKSNLTATPSSFSIVEIDDCEYIIFIAGNCRGDKFSMCHKGDCKNPIHKYNKIKTR